jgi:predicted nuclease with TOPRIM domain
MNIQTVRDNLKNTIAGKEAYLARLSNTRDMNEGAAMATEAIRSMLEINLEELKRILGDVEQCVFDYDELKDDLKEANGRVRQLEQQASDDSWITNPDRMGGGGWTADELDPNRGWK